MRNTGVPAAKKFSAGGVAVEQGDSVPKGVAQGGVTGAVYKVGPGVRAKNKAEKMGIARSKRKQNPTYVLDRLPDLTSGNLTLQATKEESQYDITFTRRKFVDKAQFMDPVPSPQDYDDIYELWRETVVREANLWTVQFKRKDGNYATLDYVLYRYMETKNGVLLILYTYTQLNRVQDKYEIDRQPDIRQINVNCANREALRTFMRSKTIYTKIPHPEEWTVTKRFTNPEYKTELSRIEHLGFPGVPLPKTKTYRRRTLRFV